MTPATTAARTLNTSSQYRTSVPADTSERAPILEPRRPIISGLVNPIRLEGPDSLGDVFAAVLDPAEKRSAVLGEIGAVRPRT